MKTSLRATLSTNLKVLPPELRIVLSPAVLLLPILLLPIMLWPTVLSLILDTQLAKRLWLDYILIEEGAITICFEYD